MDLDWMNVYVVASLGVILVVLVTTILDIARRPRDTPVFEAWGNPSPIRLVALILFVVLFVVGVVLGR